MDYENEAGTGLGGFGNVATLTAGGGLTKGKGGWKYRLAVRGTATHLSATATRATPEKDMWE